MSAAEVYQNYLRNQVQTASPEKLLLMLYDGAIRFLGQAEAACGEREWEKTNNFLLRAQEIITELICTLNPEAGEVAGQLGSLYEYMLRRLGEANVKKEAGAISEVKGLLAELREAWQEAALRSRGGGQEARGLNVRG